MKKSIRAYIVFLLAFDVFSYLFIDPNFIYLRLLFTDIFQTQRFLVSSGYVIFIMLFFLFYWYFLKEIQKEKLTQKNLLHLAIATGIILLFSYPAMLSFDIFNYITTAKVAFFYHENPYIIMPIEFLGDPMLLFTHAANNIALYGPVWILLTGIPFFLGFNNVLVTIGAFKLFVGLWYIATVWLLWHMTKSVLKTAFFALNPLVIIETLVSGHNDIVMMGLFLISVLFLFEKGKGKSIVFFLFSVCIKYATLITTPLYLLAIMKNISQKTFFRYTTIFMYIIFFLSTFREEIYPWYAIWFLLPTAFLFGDNMLSALSLSLSFGLLLRYTPFMLLDTYLPPTPLIKTLVTVIPAICAVIIFLSKKHLLWKK